ncbi:protein YvfG [Fictibacillus iocasae]|uniref:Protein YvfG n=1 Tax=Fictibacillus iocasae TaxID=2715437 RepID=A0ABW2NQM1_9BACL
MSESFSIPYFEENLRQFIERNADVFTKTHAMNAYYRSIVGTLINDNLNKNGEIVRRIRNLEEAYKNVKSES